MLAFTEGAGQAAVVCDESCFYNVIILQLSQQQESIARLYLMGDSHSHLYNKICKIKKTLDHNQLAKLLNPQICLFSEEKNGLGFSYSLNSDS